MIIDIHSHCYKNPLPFVTPFCNPEELISFYNKQGIDKAVLLPVVNSEIYFPQSNFFYENQFFMNIINIPFSRLSKFLQIAFLKCGVFYINKGEYECTERQKKN